MSTHKKLIKEARAQGINLKTLFPRLKVNNNTKLSKYALTKLKREIKSREINAPEKTKQVLMPDRPDIYAVAGFETNDDYVFWQSDKLVVTNLYHAEGDSEFYRATFFGGVVNAQLIPLFMLPEYLEYQIASDEENGAFYDAISLREGDRDMHGAAQGLGRFHETAEDLLEYLLTYKRHGALIGEGGSFDYIQVCFINFGG